MLSILLPFVGAAGLGLIASISHVDLVNSANTVCVVQGRSRALVILFLHGNDRSIVRRSGPELRVLAAWPNTAVNTRISSAPISCLTWPNRFFRILY